MSKYNYFKIGERFRSERKKLRLSQQGLIDRIRGKEKPTVGRNILSQLENGDEAAFNGISIAQLTAFCEEFGCSISYLLGEYEAHTYDLEFIHEKTGLSESAINQLYNFNNIRHAILNALLEDIRFSYDLFNDINSCYSKYYNLKEGHIQYQKERDYKESLTNGDIFKEMQLLENGTLSSTISRQQLAERDEAYQAARFRIQKKFDNIIELLLKYFYEKNHSV